MHFSIGDVVKVRFEHQGNLEHIIKVTNKTLRYGKHRDFLVEGTPIIETKCKSCEEEIHDYCPFCNGTGFITKVTCASHFVVEMVEKGKTQIGLYHNRFEKNTGSVIYFQTKSTISGSFYSVYLWAIKKIQRNILREINWDRTVELYYKTKEGFVTDNYLLEDTRFGAYITVNKKKFVKWVYKNLDKCLMTAKEMDIEAIREEEWNAAIYEQDMMKELEEDYKNMVDDFCENGLMNQQN